MMDAAVVRRAMICPPTWEGDRNDLGIEASERYPDRFGVMARIPLQRPEEERADPELETRDPGRSRTADVLIRERGQLG